MKVHVIGSRGTEAWTLPEVMFAVMVLAISGASLFVGFAQGFSLVRFNQENLRATQILAERMETIRLYTWDQLNTPGFVPVAFTNYSYTDPVQGEQGVAYVGRTTISAAPLMETYQPDLRQVTVTLRWTSGSIQHQRTMATLVSKYGIQNYVYAE